MEKRYQVFISSTYTDLQEERQCAISGLLDINCIPVGMEQFPASSLSQWDYIKKMIDTSDYYVLIVAGKYGSIDPDENISYTEKEYNYAVSKNLPILTFLFEDINKIAGGKLEDSDSGRKKLKVFRDKLMNANRLVKFYSNIDDLKSKITTSVNQAIIDTPAIGWIRADEVESNQTDLTERLSVLERTSIKVVPVNGNIVQLMVRSNDTFKLSEDAIKLLVETSEDPKGGVLVLNNLNGKYFNTNGKNLNENGFGKEVAKWESAISELINNGFAKSQSIGNNDEVIRLTKHGYDMAEKINCQR